MVRAIPRTMSGFLTFSQSDRPDFDAAVLIYSRHDHRSDQCASRFGPGSHATIKMGHHYELPIRCDPDSSSGPLLPDTNGGWRFFMSIAPGAPRPRPEKLAYRSHRCCG
jgi:hypothetical protein